MRNDGPTSIPDRRTLERALESVRARTLRAEAEDIVVDGERRLVLRSPNGHYWAIGLDDAGAFVATDIGTQSP